MILIVNQLSEQSDIFYNQDNDPMQNGGSFKSNVDLLIGGSPCTDLSISKRNRQSLNGSQSSLFFEYVRILKEVKPKFFILENVNSMSNDAKNEITKNLFGIEPILINSSLLTAQHRKRIYWVGSLGLDGNYTKVEISQPEDKGILLKDILESGDTEKLKSYCITATYSRACPKDYFEHGQRQLVFKKPVRVGHFNKGGQGDRIYSSDGKSVCLSANGGGRGARTGLYEIKGCAIRGRYKNNSNETEQTLEIREDEKTNCLTSVSKDSLVQIKDMVRKLTPTECARLQGYPDKKKIIDFKISSIKINQINNLIEKWQNYIDLQKKNAPAETKNHKLQKYVEIASTKNLTDNVISAEQILNTSHQNLKKLVVKNVLINCEELTLETPNLGRLKLLANNALIENLYRHQTIIESFVAEIVGIILTQGKEIKDGEGEICQNIQNSFFQLNGKNYAERYGQDIAELVKDVERSLTERNIGHFIATISEAGKNFRAYEWSCLTLFCYVIVAIVMSTQEKIQIESLLEISIKSSYHQGISNSQAYKCYGNSFTVPIIEHLLKHIFN